LSLQQGELYRGEKLSYSTSERLLNAQGLHLQNEQLLGNTRATGVSTKPLWNWYITATCSTKDTTVVGGEKKKKGNTKPQALTEFESGEVNSPGH